MRTVQEPGHVRGTGSLGLCWGAGHRTEALERRSATLEVGAIQRALGSETHCLGQSQCCRFSLKDTIIICMCVYACMYIYVCMCMHVYRCMFMNVHVCVCMSMSACVHVCV